MDSEKIGFTQGVVYAIAMLLRSNGTMDGEQLWNESGFTKDDLKLCDDYDTNEIRNMLKQT